MKCYIYIVVLFLAFVHGSEEDFRRIDSVYQEQQCSRAGGSCTIAEDCPEGSLSEERGLCPEQRQKGIECCHGVSEKESRCIKHGGVCMSVDTFCNPILVLKRTTDCPAGEKCCIMTL